VVAAEAVAVAIVIAAINKVILLAIVPNPIHVVAQVVVQVNKVETMIPIN
jgi:hypothetical protein